MENFEKYIVKYNNASVIAGFEGSNMHNILFSKPNTKQISFNHRNRYTINQKNCDKISLSNVLYIEENFEKDMNNFDWKRYIKSYKDLKINGVNNKKNAIKHYLNYGKKANRIFFLKKSKIEEIENKIKSFINI